MRTLLYCLLFVLASAPFAPTSEDLRKLYGGPVTAIPLRVSDSDSEKFSLAPNIELTAQYGPDQQACTITLEPKRLPSNKQPVEYGEQLMSSTRISEILEQVAPADKRGKALLGSGGVFCAGSNGIWNQNYANVYILHDIRCMEGSNSVKRVRIWFKQATCAKPDWYPVSQKSPQSP